MESVVVTSIISAVAALVAAALTAVLTALLTRRRERDADWRKLRLAQYQEYIAALSGIVEWRSSGDAQRRHSDAANSLLLVAPQAVLLARDAFLAEISSSNPSPSREAHDRHLNELLRAMRQDIHPGARVTGNYRFFLHVPSPERPLA